MTGHHPQPAAQPPRATTQPWPHVRRPAHPRAALSLVLGIVGLGGLVLLVPFAVSPLAWYFGAVARREAERDERRWSPSPMATAGMIMGAIGTVLLLAAVLVLGGVTLLTSMLMGTDTGY